MADPINCDDLDERLTPYVDGEAEPADRAAVGAHLNRCPPCRKHADDERTARELVREHRAELCPQAPPALRDRCLQLRDSVGAQAATGRGSRYGGFVRRWAPLSVAATLVLAVAGVFVFGLNNRVEALAASLAVDHVKCFKVSAPDASADAPAESRQWQQDQGWPVAVPASAPAEQLQLLDVRRCYSTDGKAAHMMYKWRGAPLSLYVLPEETGHDQIVRKVGHRAVIWSANRRTYAVVDDGQSPPEDLTRVIGYLKANVQ
jgi:anti-sigma factor (TIGR02949 family)